MRRGGIEEQRIAGIEREGAIAMAITHAPGQHVDEFLARVTKRRVGLGAAGEADEVRLDRDLTAQRVAEQLIFVARARAAPLDLHALAGGDVRAIAALFELVEQRADRHVERARQRLQRRERRRDLAVLDLRDITPFAL